MHWWVGECNENRPKTGWRKKVREGSQEGKPAFILKELAEFGDLEGLF